MCYDIFLGNVNSLFLLFAADTNRLDSTEKTAWDYAEEKELHYCQMIINSYQPHSERKSSRGRNQYNMQVCSFMILKSIGNSVLNTDSSSKNN